MPDLHKELGCRDFKARMVWYGLVWYVRREEENLKGRTIGLPPQLQSARGWRGVSRVAS